MQISNLPKFRKIIISDWDMTFSHQAHAAYTAAKSTLAQYGINNQNNIESIIGNQQEFYSKFTSVTLQTSTRDIIKFLLDKTDNTSNNNQSILLKAFLGSQNKLLSQTESQIYTNNYANDYDKYKTDGNINTLAQTKVYLEIRKVFEQEYQQNLLKNVEIIDKTVKKLQKIGGEVIILSTKQQHKLDIEVDKSELNIIGVIGDKNKSDGKAVLNFINQKLPNLTQKDKQNIEIYFIGDRIGDLEISKNFKLIGFNNLSGIFVVHPYNDPEIEGSISTGKLIKNKNGLYNLQSNINIEVEII